MAKKFDTQNATSKFFTQETQVAGVTQDTQSTHETQNKQGKGRPKADKKKRGFRYNLTLDADLNGFLHQIAWENKQSMTQYLNDLLRREKENYVSNGGKLDPYFDEQGAK